MLIVHRMVAAAAMQPAPQPARCEQQQHQACGDGQQDAMLPQEVAQGFHCRVAVPAAASLEILVRAAASTTPEQHGSLGGANNGGSGELGVRAVVTRSTTARIRKFEMSEGR